MKRFMLSVFLSLAHFGARLNKAVVVRAIDYHDAQTQAAGLEDYAVRSGLFAHRWKAGKRVVRSARRVRELLTLARQRAV